MKNFFEGIQYLFEDILFTPLHWLRNLELESWWAANTAKLDFHHYMCNCTSLLDSSIEEIQ